MIEFTTETGSRYLWDATFSRLKRVLEGGESQPLQKDGEWVRILGDVYLELGRSAVFAMDVPNNRFRVTSSVTDIREIHE